MDKNTRWVVLGFIGIGIILAWILIQTLITAFHYVDKYFSIYNLNKELFGLGENFTIAHLGGIILTVLIASYCWRNETVHRSSHEVVEELRKVTWPTGPETQTATIVVIVSTIIISVILWIYDIFWAKLTSLFL
jgi:preprotein translocase SecE subunit